MESSSHPDHICVCHGDAWASNENMLEHQVYYYCGQLRDFTREQGRLHDLMQANHQRASHLLSMQARLSSILQLLDEKDKKLQQQAKALRERRTVLRRQARLLEKRSRRMALLQAKYGLPPRDDEP